MTRLRRDVYLLALCVAVLAPAGGCDGTSNEPNAPPELRNAPGPVAEGPGGPGMTGPGPAGKGAPMRETRRIMARLNQGPGGLQNAIGSELKTEKTPWETIQPQTKEYAQLAGDLGKHDPPKGSKESWAKLTAEYAGLADALDKAAQAKDKDAATAAHQDLASSCNACHRQHRGGPGMMGGPGMGGRPGFGPQGGGRPGGGPPGGPGGGPPPGGPAGGGSPPPE